MADLLLALTLLQAAAPPVIRANPPSAERPVRTEAIPARARAVVDHVDALYKGDIEGSLAFGADDVENAVSNLSSNIHFPPGKRVTYAMYLSMTKKGKLGVSRMACAPEDQAIRCDLLLGTGRKARDFTMRYFADGGPITRVLSWENHKGKSH